VFGLRSERDGLLCGGFWREGIWGGRIEEMLHLSVDHVTENSVVVVVVVRDG
jgi:hypothetical protein